MNFEDMSPADQFMLGEFGPMPEPAGFMYDRIGTVPAYTDAEMRAFAEQERAEAVADIAKLVGALELIAVGPRSDGTFNRDREACRQLALQALHVLRRSREETRSQKLAKAGFKRRKTWRSLPSDE